MDFLAAARKIAIGADWSEDLGMTSQPEINRVNGQPDPSTDEQDPATPGGPSPFNGAAPFGEPVASDPMWLDPQGDKPKRYESMPFQQGPDEDVTTLHNARRSAYIARSARFDRKDNS